MLRREFLRGLTAGAATAALGSRSNSFATVEPRRAAGSTDLKLNRIAISTWSLRNYFRATRRSDFNLPGPMLVLLDFPEMILEKYKVHHLEFCSTHFPSTEPVYLLELKYALLRSASTIVNISVDTDECGPEGTFSDPDPQERAAALNAVKQWVDVAHTLGARSVRVGPGKVDPEHLGRAAEAYKALSTYALAKGVQVIVENHGSFGTTEPEELVKLFKLVGPWRIGALPDFANFSDEPTRERGLKMLFPYAQIVCHANGLKFDADGDETEYDFRKAVEIAKKAAFRGVYSIAFEGPGDPYVGIQKTLEELLKSL